MNIKDTKTEENLRKALAGESIARNKYTYFAEVARKNGNEDIAKAFEQMSKNEMMHAKFWFEQLFGKQDKTEKCLEIAAKGEFDEWHDMYPSFAKQAREDGLDELAVMFEKVADIERSHEKRFLTLLNQLRLDILSNKPTEDNPEAQKAAKDIKAQTKKMGYRCQFCGVIHDEPMDVCDVCQAIGSFEAIEYYE